MSAPCRHRKSYSRRLLSDSIGQKARKCKEFGADIVFAAAAGGADLKTLTPPVLVRIQLPQPIEIISLFDEEAPKSGLSCRKCVASRTQGFLRFPMVSKNFHAT
jgi:hypothetical protein